MWGAMVWLAATLAVGDTVPVAGAEVDGRAATGGDTVAAATYAAPSRVHALPVAPIASWPRAHPLLAGPSTAPPPYESRPLAGSTHTPARVSPPHSGWMKSLVATTTS